MKKDEGIFLPLCLVSVPQGVAFKAFKSFHTFVSAESSPEDATEKNRLCQQADGLFGNMAGEYDW